VIPRSARLARACDLPDALARRLRAPAARSFSRQLHRDRSRSFDLDVVFRLVAVHVDPPRQPVSYRRGLGAERHQSRLDHCHPATKLRRLATDRQPRSSSGVQRSMPDEPADQRIERLRPLSLLMPRMVAGPAGRLHLRFLGLHAEPAGDGSNRTDDRLSDAARCSCGILAHGSAQWATDT
jgi:hypothetical protein